MKILRDTGSVQALILEEQLPSLYNYSGADVDVILGNSLAGADVFPCLVLISEFNESDCSKLPSVFLLLFLCVQ